ncbi:MAG: hypothetical protein RLW62_14660 [Gammaproteobacteria bacterium]
MSTLSRTFARLLRGALLALLAGCGSDGAYEPLAPGLWWVYAVESEILDEPRVARYLARNAARGTLDGQAVVARRHQAWSVDYLHADDAGIVRVAHRHGRNGTLTADAPARVLLPLPAVAGTSWSTASTLGLIESRTFARQDRVIVRRYPVTLEMTVIARDGVTRVPAGEFDACLVVEGNGRTSVRTDRGNASALVTVHTREWYAPGIGLVRREREERSTSPFLKNGRQVWTLLEHGR